MNRITLVFCVGLLGLSALVVRAADDASSAPADATTQPTVRSNAANLDELMVKLRKSAEEFLGSGKTDAAIEKEVKILSYDDAVQRSLAGQLKSLKGDTPRERAVNLYVAAKLVKPLLMAKTEVVRESLPAVLEFHNAYGKYQNLPVYTPAELKRFNPPDDPKLSEPVRKAQAAAAQKAQDEKVAGERVIQLHNEQLYAFEKILWQLVLFAEDPERDALELGWLTKAANEHSIMFFHLLDVLKNQSRDVGKERAKQFYDHMLKLGDEIRWVKADFTDPSVVQISRTENSTFKQETKYPGVTLLDILNLFATTARQPAMVVPTTKQVDQHNAQKNPDPRKHKDFLKG